jgi:hypothetical protein
MILFIRNITQITTSYWNVYSIRARRCIRVLYTGNVKNQATKSFTCVSKGLYGRASSCFSIAVASKVICAVPKGAVSILLPRLQSNALTCFVCNWDLSTFHLTREVLFHDVDCIFPHCASVSVIRLLSNWWRTHNHHAGCSRSSESSGNLPAPCRRPKL